MLQEFLKLAMPDCLVRGTDLFSLNLSNKKNGNSQDNNKLPGVNISKLHLFFCQMGKTEFFLVCCRILVISLCAMK